MPAVSLFFLIIFHRPFYSREGLLGTVGPSPPKLNWLPQLMHGEPQQLLDGSKPLPYTMKMPSQSHA